MAFQNQPSAIDEKSTLDRSDESIKGEEAQQSFVCSHYYYPGGKERFHHTRYSLVHI